MPAFKYVGRNIKGDVVRGRVEASDQRAALQELTRQGYFVSELELDRDVSRKDFSVGSLKNRFSSWGRITSRDLGIFARQLGVLYDAGIPVMPALAAIRQQQGADSPLGRSLKGVERRLNAGDSLALAMRDEGSFPAILVNMVAAGEVGGTLDDALFRAATYFEREYEISQKVKSALTYPKFVAVVALAITWFLLASVVPNFAQIFSGADMELPGITLFMLGLSDFLLKWGFIVFILLAGGLFVYGRWKRTEQGKQKVDTLTLKLPLFGKLVGMNAVSRFARTLAALIRSGVNVVNALELSEQTVDNAVYTAAVQEAARIVGEGGRLATALEDSDLFPPMVLQMVQVGENSGSLDSMLNQVADFYDQDLNTLTERLGKMIEPVVLLVMALVVGLIALAIALPMMQMVDIVQF